MDLAADCIIWAAHNSELSTRRKYWSQSKINYLKPLYQHLGNFTEGNTRKCT